MEGAFKCLSVNGEQAKRHQKRAFYQLFKSNNPKPRSIQLFLYFCEQFFVNLNKTSCSEWDENL